MRRAIKVAGGRADERAMARRLTIRELDERLAEINGETSRRLSLVAKPIRVGDWPALIDKHREMLAILETARKHKGELTPPADRAERRSRRALLVLPGGSRPTAAFGTRGAAGRPDTRLPRLLGGVPPAGGIRRRRSARRAPRWPSLDAADLYPAPTHPHDPAHLRDSSAVERSRRRTRRRWQSSGPAAAVTVTAPLAWERLPLLP